MVDDKKLRLTAMTVSGHPLVLTFAKSCTVNELSNATVCTKKASDTSV